MFAHFFEIEIKQTASCFAESASHYLILYLRDCFEAHNYKILWLYL